MSLYSTAADGQMQLLFEHSAWHPGFTLVGTEFGSTQATDYIAGYHSASGYTDFYRTDGRNGLQRFRGAFGVVVNSKTQRVYTSASYYTHWEGRKGYSWGPLPRETMTTDPQEESPLQGSSYLLEHVTHFLAGRLISSTSEVDVLSYDRVSGDLEVLVATERDITSTPIVSGWRPGWDLIVPNYLVQGDAFMAVLCYQKETHDAAFYRFTPDGSPQLLASPTGWTHWDQIVPWNTVS